jgi:hypothetical protein
LILDTKLNPYIVRNLKEQNKSLINHCMLQKSVFQFMGYWQLLVILVGARQTAEGRRKEEGKIIIIETLLGL